MAKQTRMWDVIDINFDEIVHSFRDQIKAHECARDMNEGKLDKMYVVREGESHEARQADKYGSPERVARGWIG